MFTYYLALALISLKRNVVLTALMIAAIGVGIGASMTTLTVFRAMARNPIPDKAAQLFAVQIDNWGPRMRGLGTGDPEGFQEQLSYLDAKALMDAHRGRRQSAMYVAGMALLPANPDLKPFQVLTRAAYTDMFTMFEVPFLYGAPWSAEDDRNHADVVIISRGLNDKVFGGANSVGKTLNFENHDYRVVGVTDEWNPTPKYYDLNNEAFGKSEQAFMPFSRVIDLQKQSSGNFNCNGDIGGPGWEGRLKSECVWLQYWVELPTAADVQHYRDYLNGYAAEQQHNGRFHWSPHTRLRDVTAWLDYRHVVSQDTRILVLVSFSFLLVCLLNAMGLMLAKILGRAADIGVRRALGANRRAIFSQCLIESGVVGLAGGVLGLGLTVFGLMGLRALLSERIAQLTHLGVGDIALAVGLSVLATMLAGLYPTWRASQVQPAWQLKNH